MSIVVTCTQIIKTYGDKKETLVMALRGLDMEVYAGELLMLVGPSGSGKTTLLSVMSGILTQDSGSCTLFGTEINKLDDEAKTAFRKEHIGFIFQSFNLIPSLTALENASIPLILNGESPKAAEEKAAYLLEKVGLKNRMHALPPHLSGGEQQRVAICRGFVHQPKLIVCDEPTSNLDHEVGHLIMGLLKEIAKKENRALVVVTHDPRIFEFADRILKMDDGKIIGQVNN